MFLSLSLVTLMASAVPGSASATAPDKESRVYELRVYYAAKGKLDDLHARFRNHTVKLFEKHGMTNIGYWVPLENPDERLVYILAHKSREAATASWKAFINDPEWKSAASESEKNGRLVAGVQVAFMNATDYSPEIKPSIQNGERVFELRTYATPANGLGNINARFRDHTIKLFEKYGMSNLAYWNLATDEKNTLGKLYPAVSPRGQGAVEGEPNAAAAPVTLIYLLAHASVEARNKSFDAFRMDPDWIAARTASEQKAGGSLTVKDGVKSLMLKPTDYSPWK